MFALAHGRENVFRPSVHDKSRLGGFRPIYMVQCTIAVTRLYRRALSPLQRLLQWRGAKKTRKMKTRGRVGDDGKGEKAGARPLASPFLFPVSPARFRSILPRLRALTCNLSPFPSPFFCPYEKIKEASAEERAPRVSFEQISYKKSHFV